MCGLNPRKVTLRGNEVRTCWVGAPASRYDSDPAAATRAATPRTGAADTPARQVRTFVPVEDVAAARDARPAPVLPAMPADAASDQGTWSLWGDAEG
jgi:hypothetical protein